MAATLLKKLSPARGGSDETEPVRQRLRVAVSRAAMEFSGLVAAVTGATQSETGLTEMGMAAASNPGNFVLQDRDGNPGLACFDAQLAAGLLEHATTGRIVPGEVVARRLTRTDAVLLASFVNTLLVQLDTELDGYDTRHGTGFRFARTLPENGSVEMSFKDCHYRGYQIQVDLGNGERSGEVNLFLPVVAGAGNRNEPKLNWRAEFKDQVYRSCVQVEAILHRLNMPLEDVEGLEPGYTFVIPAARIARVALTGVNGQTVCLGKLGRQGAHRAIRLHAATKSDAAAQIGAEIAFAAEPPTPPPLVERET